MLSEILKIKKKKNLERYYSHTTVEPLKLWKWMTPLKHPYVYLKLLLSKLFLKIASELIY